MTFFSLEFALIFLLFFLVYWSLAAKFRAQNALILLANYAFVCSFSPIFALVLGLHTFFIAFFGLYIAYRRRLDALIFGLFFALAYLCFFKYFDLIWADFKELLLFLKFDWLAQNLEIAFPIGISFYTFTSITYLVNIYQRRHAPANFITLACYLSFFATLLAGPIARSDFMLPQFERERKFENSDQIFMLVLLGVVKKALIANYFQGYVLDVFDEPEAHSSVQILTAIYGYGIWLYCDFSGYVNIVTALALALGFTLPPNFDMPYAALNLRDFWRRWHISLSLFIRDYVYIPLGGSRRGFWLTQLNLLIAFGLSGVWHGVGWGFFVWGVLHGMGVIWLNCMDRFGLNLSSRAPMLSRFITFSFVSVAWVFFTKSDLGEANAILLALFSQPAGLNLHDLLALGGLLAIFFIYPYTSRAKEFIESALAYTPTFLQPLVLAVLFCMIFAVMPEGIPSFIYSSF